MKENVVLSSREQITLPAHLRKRLGLRPGDVLTLEEKGGQLILLPVLVMEMEIYDDQDIARWEEKDTFAPGEREALLRRLNR